MKTITNTSRTARTLAREWDEDTGIYDYYFLTPSGERRVLMVEVEGKTYSPRSWYGREVRAGRMQGRFFYANVPVGNTWTHELEPGESVTVPAHRETYHQHALRTGEFRPSINRCLAVES